MRLQMSSSALDILDCAEDRSDHDEGADGVEDVYVTGPGRVDLAGLDGRASSHTAVKQADDDDEEGKDKELHAETADDEVATEVGFLNVSI